MKILRPDVIDLALVYDDFVESDKVGIANGIYIFLDNFLGELNAITSIDHLKVIGSKLAEAELLSILKLI